MLDKLAELSQRFDEVNEALADPDVVLDQARYQRLSREHSDLEVVVQTFRDCIQRKIREYQHHLLYGRLCIFNLFLEGVDALAGSLGLSA